LLVLVRPKRVAMLPKFASTPTEVLTFVPVVENVFVQPGFRHTGTVHVSDLSIGLGVAPESGTSMEDAIRVATVAVVRRAAAVVAA
jgi:hypothetical protein